MQLQDTPDGWRRVKAALASAQERPAEARAAYLADLRARDPALAGEVASLLAASPAESFMNAPDQGADEGGWLSPGTSFGRYQIVGLLGHGGMGEVYRARDGKLKRDVALKILPGVFADDPRRAARFQREAELLASLNHPNIAAIYGLEEAQATTPTQARATALVLELVEGETLAELLTRAPGRMPSAQPNGLPVFDALHIARQIAEALEAAHEAGVIHRDLKPANVMVQRGRGTARDKTVTKVKVLDFSLGKVCSPDGPDRSLPGLFASSLATTGRDVIMGTAAYMSPEQARGQGVDRRTDVWSFGLVLYEMLTGQSASSRNTVADAIVAVLEGTPDWTRLPDTTPAGVRPLLVGCLEKDAGRRPRDMGDVRLAIEDAIETLAPSAAPTTPDAVSSASSSGARSPAAVLTGAALAFVLGALAAVAIVNKSPTPVSAEVAEQTAVVDRDLAPAAAQTIERAIGQVAELLGATRVGAGAGWGRLTWYDRTGSSLGSIGEPGQYGGVVLSPDDRRVAVHRHRQRDGGNIWVADEALNTFEPLTSGPVHDIAPMWSPDGESIVFASNRDGRYNLYRKDATGAGGVERLSRSRIHQVPETWSPDGQTLIFAQGNSSLTDLWTLPLGGNAPPTVLMNGRFSEFLSEFSPDGRWIAYTSTETGRYEVYVRPYPAQGRQRISIEGGRHPRWSGDGRELFYLSNDGRVMAVEIAGVDGDRRTLSMRAPRALFRASVARHVPGGTPYDVSRDGRRFLINEAIRQAPQQASSPAPVVALKN